MVAVGRFGRSGGGGEEWPVRGRALWEAVEEHIPVGKLLDLLK